MQQGQQREETVPLTTQLLELLAGQSAVQLGAPGTPDAHPSAGYDEPRTPPSDADLETYDKVLRGLSQRLRMAREMAADHDETLLEILVDMRRKVETWVQAGYPRDKLQTLIQVTTEAVASAQRTPPGPTGEISKALMRLHTHMQYRSESQNELNRLGDRWTHTWEKRRSVSVAQGYLTSPPHPLRRIRDPLRGVPTSPPELEIPQGHPKAMPATVETTLPQLDQRAASSGDHIACLVDPHVKQEYLEDITKLSASISTGVEEAVIVPVAGTKYRVRIPPASPATLIFTEAAASTAAAPAEIKEEMAVTNEEGPRSPPRMASWSLPRGDQGRLRAATEQPFDKGELPERRLERALLTTIIEQPGAGVTAGPGISPLPEEQLASFRQTLSRRPTYSRRREIGTTSTLAALDIF